ncbi:MAG TPA: peptidyl-prolyl cis-trans isomerase, partial [Thermoanaerobaculia bacterium]|nr:peptidyl-prolyl cis-trans isomerase [Thermoanaerobaculia bacterium]
ALEGAIVVSPKAAEAEYRRVSESAKIRYVLYQASRAAATVTVTPQEVDTYYRNNQAKYQHNEQRSIRYLLADTGLLRARITPPETELRKRYDASREEFKRPDAAHVLHILIKVEPNAPPAVDAAAKAKADALVAQLRAGGDFAAAAKANSQDPSSAATGGDMGFVDRGQTVQAFEEKIFSVPLNTVDVVRSAEFGYHIVKVVERRTAGYRSFEEVRPELSARVADDMAKDQARNEIAVISTKLRDKKPKTVDEFVSYANDRVASYDSKWFQKTDSIPNLGSNAPLTAWVFAAKEGDIGEVTGTPKGMLIPYLSGIRPRGITALAEIRDKVDADAKTEKARGAARQALAAAMAGAVNIDAVGQKVQTPIAETTVNRQGFIGGFQGDTSALVTSAMSANIGSLQGPIAVGDGAVAFQVTEQKKVTDAELAQKRSEYIDALRQQQSRNLRAALLQRLRKEAKIQINQEVIQPPGQGGAPSPVGM